MVLHPKTRKTLDSKLLTRLSLELSPRMPRLPSLKRRTPSANPREDAQEARRSRTLLHPQLRRRRSKLMKRLLLLPRLMEASRDATVATVASRMMPKTTTSLLSATKEPDRRVARIAKTLEMLSRDSSVGHPLTSTISAEKFLATTSRIAIHMLATEEEAVSIVAAEAAELTSRRGFQITEALDLPMKSATATATCQTTEEVTTNTSLSMIDKAGAVTTSLTSLDQATIPLREDQSDLP